MANCPNCNSILKAVDKDYHKYNECENCQSLDISYHDIRELEINRKYLSTALEKAKNSSQREGYLCRLCNMRMYKFSDEITHGEMHICSDCKNFWLPLESIKLFPTRDETYDVKLNKVDYTEFHELRRKVEEEEDGDKYINFCNEQMQLYEEHDSFGKTYSFKDAIAGFLSIPVEEDSSFFDFYPLVTWTILLIIIVTYLISKQDLINYIYTHGFIPALWARSYGITAITSFLTHAGFWHLFGNGYFLLIFGDNVENEIGRLKYILLILTAHIVGLLLHSLLDPNKNIPVVGASAGISGIMAFYCIAFPKMKISWVIRFFYKFYKIKFPAWLFLCLWLLLQIVYSILQMKGGGSVSALGHLGGVIVGITAVIFYKHHKDNQPKKKTADEYKNVVIS